MKYGWCVGSLVLGLVVCAQAADPMTLRQFGAHNQNVIYVFTSPSCPHCAYYHQYVWPRIQEKFVKTGKAQVRIVDMPYDAQALRIVHLSRCMDEPVYDAFISEIYAHQSDWRNTFHPEAELEKYAVSAGFSAAEQKACLALPQLEEKIRKQRDNLSDLYRVYAMPTTVVDTGKKPFILKGADADVIISEITKELAIK